MKECTIFKMQVGRSTCEGVMVKEPWRASELCLKMQDQSGAVLISGQPSERHGHIYELKTKEKTA